MEAYSTLLTVAVVSLVAAISPGPDFFIVLKNSLAHSRKVGLLTALGVGAALIFHLAYTVMGIGVVIAESPFAYALIKYAGVGYLFYIGFSSIVSSYKNTPSIDLNIEKSDSHISGAKAFSQGFLTNLLNPKAAFFFISLFSQFIDPSTPVFLRIEYVVVNWSMSVGWFFFLAYITTIKGFLGKIAKWRLYIDRIMGGALMLLGLKLLFV